MKKYINKMKFLLLIFPLIAFVLRFYRNPDNQMTTSWGASYWYAATEWAKTMISSNNISLNIVRFFTDRGLLSNADVIKIPIGYLTYATYCILFFVPFDLYNWFLSLGRKESTK